MMDYQDSILVSVCCMTYNHEHFIEKCLTGFVSQKTNFAFEILVHEDASTDGTSEIVKIFETNHPKLFRVIYQKENVFSTGKNNLTGMLFPMSKGKYIALCEGDDYWTDPLKLQKQVDFLEANPDFVGVFHDCFILDERDGSQHLRIGNTKIDEEPDLQSIIRENNISTASIVFRNFEHSNFWPDNSQSISKGDYLLVVLLAQYGKFKYFNSPMSVYRIHPGGIWSSRSRLYTIEQDVKFYTFLDSFFQKAEIKDAIHYKLQKAYHKYAIELVKSSNMLKSLHFLNKSLNMKVSEKKNKKRFIITYLIVVLSSFKKRFFPFFPSLYSVINRMRNPCKIR